MIETLLEMAGAIFAVIGIVAFIGCLGGLAWKLVAECIRSRYTGK